MSAKDVFEDGSLRRLAEAGCQGDAESVYGTVNAGTDPNGAGLRGFTPLAWAVSCDNVQGVQALLEAGADPNQTIGEEFSSVVYIAVGRNDPGPLKALLEAGAEADVFDLKSERTGLTQALSRGIEAGDWRYWDLLLESADINRPHDKFGGTIATYAASFNQFERVVQLLEKGYSYRLPVLGRYVEMADHLVEPFATWQREAMRILNGRGVVFPVGPIPPEALPEAELKRLPPSYQ
ncbi:ankyrin repeat domain-containing protein [Pseudomonas sp. NyZ704]|nr:ankyrin repeat domain-containing protein [Pseudomonas sp. NyZ704]